MKFGLLPQVLPNLISYVLLRFEINIRASTILGFVGAGGIGQELYLVINFNYYEEVSAIILLIILTVVSIDLFSGYLRKILLVLKMTNQEIMTLHPKIFSPLWKRSPIKIIFPC